MLDLFGHMLGLFLTWRVCSLLKKHTGLEGIEDDTRLNINFWARERRERAKEERARGREKRHGRQYTTQHQFLRDRDRETDRQSETERRTERRTEKETTDMADDTHLNLNIWSNITEGGREKRMRWERDREEKDRQRRRRHAPQRQQLLEATASHERWDQMRRRRIFRRSYFKKVWAPVIQKGVSTSLS